MNPIDRIRELKDSEPGITLERIAAILNQEGLTSPGGGQWWPSSVSTAMHRAGIDSSRPTFSDEALDRILELRSPEINMGLAEIGETLAAEGVATPSGGRWWPATVRRVLENAAKEGNKRAGQALERHGKRKTAPVYQGRRATDPAVLTRIVDMRKNRGMALHEIADILTQEGVPTTRGGRRWWQSTVRSALATAGYSEDE